MIKAAKNIKPKRYKVLVTGPMLNSHYKVGDPIWLYDQQTVNLIPPLGNKIEPWPEQAEEAEEVQTSPYDELKKPELIAEIIKRNDPRKDKEHHIVYKGNAKVDDLKDLLKRDDLVSEINELNESLGEDKKIQVTDEMSLEVLADLIKAA